MFINYFGWFLSGELFAFPAKEFYFWFSVVTLFILVIRWIVFLKYFYLPALEIFDNLESRYGVEVDNSTVYDQVYGMVIGPPIEELIFRSPILYLVLQEKIWLSILIAIIIAFVFGVGHRTNKIEFSNGTKIPCCRVGIWSACVGGLFYGLIVIVTCSLWPAIFLHILWNFSVLILEPLIGQNRLTYIAKKL
ncbi:MAG: CPBP family intramembrane metalloprotease [bacterium]|nr:CPBP family intramembrane metalloprotease [bacterium]